MEVGQVSARLVLDASQYQTGMGAAKRQLESMGSAIDRLNQKAAAPKFLEAFRSGKGIITPGVASGLTSGVDAAVGKLALLKSGVMSAGEVMMKQTERVRSSLGGLSLAFAGLGRLLPFALGAESLRRMGASFLDTARSMEAYRGRLRAVIKDQAEADRTFERISRWAAESPVNADEAVAAFVQLKAAAVENAEGAIRAVADLSSVMGRDMRDVSAAIISGETESLRRLGIMVDRTGREAVVQSGQFKRVVTNDIQGVRKAILEVIGLNYSGAMERTKNSFGGITKTLKGQIEMIRKDLAGLDAGSPFRNIVSGLGELSARMDVWSKSSGYRAFVRAFQSGANLVIDAGKGAVRGAGTVFGSDVTQEILKWGIGLKAAELAGKGVFSTLKGGKALLLGGLGAINSTAAKAGSAITSVGKAMDAAATSTIGWKAALGSAAGLLTPGGAMLAGMASLALAAETIGKNAKILPAELERTRETLANMTAFSGANGGGVLGSGMNASEQVEKWTKMRADEMKRSIADAMSKAHEEEAGQIAEALSADSRFSMPDMIGGLSKKLPGFKDALRDAVSDVVGRAKEEFSKADKSIAAFSLNASNVYAGTADEIVQKSDDIVRSLKSAYGSGGLLALSDALKKIGTSDKGIGAVAESFQRLAGDVTGAKAALSGLHEKMTELTAPAGDVAKAFQKGLLPKGEAEEYLRSRITQASGLNAQLAAERYAGQSGAFKEGIRKLLDAELTESFGMKRLSPRGTGGYQAQPGTIGHPSTRDEVRPAPQWRGSRSWIDDQVQATRRAEAATKQGPTLSVVINGGMNVVGEDKKKLAEIIFHTLDKRGIGREFSIAGAAQ